LNLGNIPPCQDDWQNSTNLLLAAFLFILTRFVVAPLGTGDEKWIMNLFIMATIFELQGSAPEGATTKV
jgi:hypothetical protein